MLSPLVLSFSDPSACDAHLTGGKGSSLARNAQLGFPVPDGFVVTSDGYRGFVGAEDIVGISGCAGLYAQALEAKASAIRAHLAKRELPEALVQAVRERFERIAPGTRFAVRSSGTMEDLAAAAFAGQHDTFLGIDSLEAVLERLRDCYLSLWSGRAFAYRTQRGFDHRDAAMAVVVQQMVAADVAGVAFTIDPVAGRVDPRLHRSSLGLG